MRIKVLMLSLFGTTSAAFGQAQVAPRGGDRPVEPPADRRAQPATVPPTAPAAVDAGSLLRLNGNSLLKASIAAQADPGQAQIKDVSYFAVPTPEPKVIRKHDLVTVIVREESQYSSEGQTDVSKEASLDAAIEDFVKLKLSNWEIEGGGIGPVAPRISMNGKREFKGDATVDRQDRLTARITAEVLDVKPNGTLVLQARKRIKTDDEEQVFILTGACRADDITADNSILSTQLYDLELNKSHKGAVRSGTRRGWGAKLLDVISPF